MKKGKLLIVSAPSGSGKSTIVNWLMQEHPELKLTFSVSCTSRAPRGTEQNGVEYFFITADEFRERIAKNEFLEYEEVYENRNFKKLRISYKLAVKAGEEIVCKYANVEGRHICCIFGKNGDLRTQIEFD